ncbi:MAG: hypothetical protein VX951_06370 [Planctomycetota bacterium]|nr:hypothetical protein [Planctomycetota bacterium]
MKVILDDLDFKGPEIDDLGLMQSLPVELRDLLQTNNGFVQFGGGLHVRGACLEPDWHSLRAAMEGPFAFHKLYDEIDETDIPFAQDCSGDQFLIRGGEVHQLAAEVGEVDSSEMGLLEFLEFAWKDPEENLCMHPLAQFHRGGGTIKPGQLLLAYPPFCTGQSGANASFRAVSAAEVITFHAQLAKKLVELEDGEELSFSAD